MFAVVEDQFTLFGEIENWMIGIPAQLQVRPDPPPAVGPGPEPGHHAGGEGGPGAVRLLQISSQRLPGLVQPAVGPAGAGAPAQYILDIGLVDNEKLHT